MPARWLSIREGVRPRAAMERGRLFDRIDRAREARVLWIAGDDGLGKSTLMATYAARRGRPCLWLDLTADDADPGILFAHFAAAPRAGAACGGMAPPHARNVLGFARRFFLQWLGRLPPDAMIVLDGCEQVAGSSLFPLILREALAVTPHGMQWCLLNGLPLCEDLAYLVTLFDGDRIGPDEFLLDEAELQALVPMARRRDPEALSALSKACAGSIGALALRLAGSSSDAQTDAMPLDAGGEARSAFQSAAQAFLAGQSETVRDALIALALPDLITADMLEALLRDGPVLRLVKSWMRRDLVLQTQGEGWRMHAVLRLMVLEMSKAQWNGGRLRDLQLALARHCERRGGPVEAIRLYALAGDWGAVSGLVRREAESEIASGRWTRVRTWIEAMPDSAIERVPMLRYWLGRALIPLDGELARLCFRRARVQFEGAGDVTGQALSLAGVLEVSLPRAGDQAQIGEWVSQLDPLLAQAQQFPSRVAEASAVRALVTGALWSATAPGGLAAHTRRLHELMGAVEIGADARLEIASCLLAFYVVSGHSDMARHVLALAGGEALLGGAGGVARAAWHEGAGLFQLLSGVREQAAVSFDAAVAAAHEEGIPEIEFRARVYRAMLNVARGRYGAAQEDLSAARSLARARDQGDAAGVAIVTAALARAHGNPQEALQQAREFLRAAPLVLPRYQLLLWGVVAAEMEIEQDASESPMLTLAQLERRAQHFCHAPWRLATALLRAEYLRRNGEGLQCRQALQQALALHRENPSWSTVLRLIPATMTRVLGHALEQGVEPAQVEALILELDLEAPSRVTPDWPWKTKLRVLGAEGNPVSPDVRALLGRLIAAGADGAAERELAQELYPGQRGVKARELLRRAIARLRIQLGGEVTLCQRGARWSLSAGHCWVDAWAFEDMAEKDPARALALYRGRLMPGVDDAALGRLRQRLHARYVDTLCAYGQSFERQSRHEAALALYRAGLEIDGACEVFFQGVMRCELHLGRVERARHAYDQLARVLGAETGEAPSGVTQALVARIEARERAVSAGADAAAEGGSE